MCTVDPITAFMNVHSTLYCNIIKLIHINIYLFVGPGKTKYMYTIWTIWVQKYICTSVWRPMTLFWHESKAKLSYYYLSYADEENNGIPMASQWSPSGPPMAPQAPKLNNCGLYTFIQYRYIDPLDLTIIVHVHK